MSKKLETESEKRARLMAMFSGQTPTAAISTDQAALDDLIARIVTGEPPETLHVTSEQMQGIFNRLGLELPNKMRTPTGAQLSRADWQTLREQLSLKIEQEESGSSSSTTPTSPKSCETQTEEEKAIERKILGDMAESSGRATSALPVAARTASSTTGTSRATAPAEQAGASDEDSTSSSPGRKYLFIGGAADGQWHAVEAGRQGFVARKTPSFLPGYTPHNQEAFSEPYKSSSYTRMPFVIGRVETAYFVCTDLGADFDTCAQVAFEMLLRGYRPHAYDDCGECRARRQRDEHYRK